MNDGPAAAADTGGSADAGAAVDAPGAVRRERAGSTLIVTIHRPEARNAVNGAVAAGIEAAVDELEGDGSLRVMVLTGTPPAFCAGADLKALNEGRGAELATARGGFGGFVQRERSKPVIAAVDGPAYGGGTELVLACDLVVASPRAAFALSEVRRGIVAGGGGMFRIMHKLPEAIALEMLLTGDPLSGTEAHRHGMVNQLCEEGDAVGPACALADRIALSAPLSVALTRDVALGARSAEAGDGWAATERAAAQVLASADAREGIAAFVEKRAPRWTGR